MTRIIKEKVKCIYGHEVESEYFDSVNIDLDPKLKQKVFNRKINFFKCNKCGYEQELVTKFLYHDMKNKLMVWVFPEYQKNEGKTLSDIPETIHKMGEALGIEQYVIFGYDELLKLLEEYEKKQK